MLNPNPKMLLRIAQGDAYCMTTEYIKFPRDDKVLEAALKFEHYNKHPTHKLDAGSYTDDTQMSIAVSEVLLTDGPYTRNQFAEAFVNCFKRDPRDGYSRGFQAILEQVIKVPYPLAEFFKLVAPNSTKNGGCMRAVPIGVVKDIPKLLEIAQTQASVTHNTAEGIWSAKAVALMSHFALYSDEPLAKLGDFLIKHLPSQITTSVVWPKKVGETVDVSHFNKVLTMPWNDKVTNRTYPEGGYYGVAIATVRACYTAITTQTNLKDILKQIIEWGGDTDSVAAIAWGIASTRFVEDLTGFWEGGLESGGKYGVPFLKKLGEDLMDKYSK